MTGESLRIQTTTSGFFSERYNAHSDSFITRQIQSKMRGCIRYLGGFSEYCIVPEQSAIRVPDAMPFDRAALIGCGVMTGVGAATRIARPGWGDTAMVIGCGAVGLSAVQGCALAGCGEIVAVDTNPARRQLAQSIGATR